MSILVVGLMLVAALNTVGASKTSQVMTSEQALGPMLAQELMTEILNQAYQEPRGTAYFGRETGESATNRTSWDDVDDYNGWSASPPMDQSGNSLPGLDDWSREVTVSWADSAAPDRQSIYSSGIKRVDVTVKHRGRTIATLSSLRTQAWPDDVTGPADLSGYPGLLKIQTK